MADATSSDLEGEPWTIVHATGAGALAEPWPKLTFTPGQVRFDAPCNFYITGTSTTNGKLSFRAFGNMPKVCGPEVMALETMLLRGLSRVTGYEIEAGGDLVLKSLEAEILRARR